jgi:hypothetical protein
MISILQKVSYIQVYGRLKNGVGLSGSLAHFALEKKEKYKCSRLKKSPRANLPAI